MDFRRRQRALGKLTPIELDNQQQGASRLNYQPTSQPKRGQSQHSNDCDAAKMMDRLLPFPKLCSAHLRSVYR